MKVSIGAKPLLFPCPVLIIGTYDEKGQANMMNAGWGGVCCSAPVCVSVSLRSATYSHSNIVKSGAFTVNIPSEKYAKQADYTGIVSGRDVDKFEKCGLTPVLSEVVYAPLVNEFPVSLECELVQKHELGLHTQFIGEVKDIKVDADVLTDERVDIKKINPLVFTFGTREYYGVGELIGKAFNIGKEFKKE